MDIDRVQQGVSFPLAYRLGGLLEAFHKITRSAEEPRMTRFLAEQLAKSHYFSIDNARKDLDYTPIISTNEGLRRTVSWLKAQ
jgi:nucleoside-diphosphate-sugar epimerase